ncbi:hypothetical protein ACP70R_021265 [Stipagrostis hirtigluma subsp. patula]
MPLVATPVGSFCHRVRRGMQRDGGGVCPGGGISLGSSGGGGPGGGISLGGSGGVDLM